MLRIYKSSNTNYIGNGSNNFILSTETGAIISNSMHSSPNYTNTFSINYNCYPSTFRSSGIYTENFTIGNYYVLAGNKIKLNFYFKYGTWFYGVNTKSSYGNYVFLINTFYVKVYKNSTLINTYTYNINGNYSNTVNAYSTIDTKSWLNNSSILVDETICNDYTSYEIRVSYDVAVTYTGVGTFNHCSMVFNDTDSKFIK